MFTLFIVIFALSITVLQIMGMIKANQKEYDSIYVTMYRGFNVAALLKENDVQDERVKPLLILNYSVNILLIAVLLYTYFSQGLSGDFIVPVAVSIAVINLFTRMITDRRIKKIVMSNHMISD